MNYDMKHLTTIITVSHNSEVRSLIRTDRTIKHSGLCCVCRL